MAKEKNRPGMMLYFDTFAVMRKYLAPEELAAAMCQLVDYAEHGIEPIDLPGAAAVAFDLIKPRLDHDAGAYEEKVRASRYGGFVKKCKAKGIKEEDIPALEDWDGTMSVENLKQPPLTSTNLKQPQATSTNLNRNRNRNRNRNITEIEREIEREGGSRRNSAAADAARKKSLLWTDADDVLREEIAVMTRDVFAEFVPLRLPDKADTVKMFEWVCSEDADGRLYVNQDKASMVRDAFAHAQEAGTPGNMVAIYRYLRDKEVSA